MDRLRRGSLKELRALQKTRPEQEPGDDTPPSAPEPSPETDPAPDRDPDLEPGPTAPEPGTLLGAGLPTPPSSGPKVSPGAADGRPSVAPAAGSGDPRKATAQKDPAGTTATNGSIVTTGPTVPAAEPGDPVSTATIDPPEEVYNPQKCRSEPTCQNGREDGEVESERKPEAGGGALALTASWGRLSEATAPGGAASLTASSGSVSEATALGGAAALTRPSGTLSQGERGCGASALAVGVAAPPAPGGERDDDRDAISEEPGCEGDLGLYAPKDPELAEIHRMIEANRRARQIADEQRKERRERQDREHRERLEELARQFDAYLGFEGDRPDPAGHDPVPGGQAGRPPPPPESGTA
jgi:hypothetical protein